MIPDKINICGIPHSVKLCEDNFTIDSHFGEICYIKAEIRINQGMPEPLQMQTLVHEWLHGALVMIGRNDLSEDENLVQCVSVAINNTFTIKEDNNDRPAKNR